jgi:hypothetical protein
VTTHDDKVLDEEIAEALEEAFKGPYLTILQAWREVLKSVESEKHADVTPAWANRITGSYREMRYADMPAFRDLYYAKVEKLTELLDAIIESDEECLKQASAEEDLEHNGKHYLAVITEWQLQLLQWEMDWNCTAENAAIDLASTAEALGTFFGDHGMTDLLETINLRFTDADTEALAGKLEAAKKAKEGR